MTDTPEHLRKMPDPRSQTDEEHHAYALRARAERRAQADTGCHEPEKAGILGAAQIVPPDAVRISVAALGARVDIGRGVDRPEALVAECFGCGSQDHRTEGRGTDGGTGLPSGGCPETVATLSMTRWWGIRPALWIT